MAGQPIVIYSAANTQQAYLLKGLLVEQGITASVVNDTIQLAGGELPLGWTTAPRVIVAESDAVQARALAEQFDREATREFRGDDSTEAEPLMEWPEWPVCPRCGQRRSARCPVCGASRTDFRLADVQESDGQQQVLLKCEDCDDLIQPEWYRLCAACGHDFGNGIESSPTSAATESALRSSTFVIAALMVGAAAFAVYFAWLFAAGR